MSKYGYLSAFLLPGMVVASWFAGGGWSFVPVIYVFVVLTTVDHLVGPHTQNIPEEEMPIVQDQYFYRLITFCWTYLQLGFVIGACYVVAIGNVTTIYEWIGMVLGCSLVTGGIGITVAHELGHKKSAVEKFYSKLLLMTVCYMHYYIAHNRGHHVHVATPQDPATARKDESFYRFWIRSVFKSYVHAWAIENEYWKRKGRSSLSFQNEMIGFTVLPLLFCVVLTLFFSKMTGALAWSVPVFFFSQSILAFTLLELANYIEHYGIVRRLQKDGRYERVNPLHSWNASHKVSNYFLFQLQRHSDHHHNAIKRYQVLNHYDESPQLPFGYPTMILIALVPPLWFSIMDPLLKTWQERIYNPLATAA